MQAWSAAHAKLSVSHELDCLSYGVVPPARGPAPMLNTGAVYVYMVDDIGAGFTKIGMTRKHPLERLKGLRSAGGVCGGSRLVLTRWWLAAADTERGLHRALSSMRVRGEWFDLASTYRDVLPTLSADAVLRMAAA